MSEQRIELIDKYELLSVLMKNDCTDRQKVFDLVSNFPVTAFAKCRYEIEMAER